MSIQQPYFHSSNIHSLYIHWPFCSTKCHYCDFVAMEEHGDYYESYHQALVKEIQNFTKDESIACIDTIFIGGGTPSLYPEEWLIELFSTLNNAFDLSQCKEISLEANPADITEEKLDLWTSLGINRLSIGVQVLDDEVLFKLNRRQRKYDVIKAMNIVPKYFDNFSLDLILGLPEIKPSEWEQTVEQVLAWNPPHISIYFLTIHEKTPLYFKVNNKTTTLPNETNILNMYNSTQASLKHHGYAQYEISNYAHQGFQSKHNKAYWDRKHYKGFGLGASSFNGTARFVNENNLKKYIQQIHQNVIPTKTHEILTQEQHTIETIMLTLRQNCGMNIQQILRTLKIDKTALFFEQLENLIAGSFLTKNENIVQLTPKGILLENEVVLCLIKAL